MIATWSWVSSLVIAGNAPWLPSSSWSRVSAVPGFAHLYGVDRIAPSTPRSPSHPHGGKGTPPPCSPVHRRDLSVHRLPRQSVTGALAARDSVTPAPRDAGAGR